jgi:hypothetical protein
MRMLSIARQHIKVMSVSFAPRPSVTGAMLLTAKLPVGRIEFKAFLHHWFSCLHDDSTFL